MEASTNTLVTHFLISEQSATQYCYSKKVFVLITFVFQNKVQHNIVIQNAFLCLPNFFFRTKCNTILLFKKRFCAYHTSAIRCHLDFSRSTLHSAPNDYNTDKLSTSIKGHTITQVHVWVFCSVFPLGVHQQSHDSPKVVN